MKRLLAVLLAGYLAVALCACGGGSSAPAAAGGTTATEPSVPITATETTPEATQSTVSNELPTEQQPSDSAPADKSTEDTPPKLEGLIVLVETCADDYSESIEVINLDITTGQQHTIANWPDWKRLCGSNGKTTAYELAHCGQRYSTSYREWFSGDYSLLACTQITVATMEKHAGWLDQQGNFYDVTAELGLFSQSDFADPVHYLAEGFNGDAFVFWDEDTDTYFSVPVSNLSPAAIQEGNPFRVAELPSKLYPDYSVSYPVSCWLSDTTCLIDDYTTSGEYHCNTYIADLTAKTTTEYIPGSSRYNFCGVLSPDGTDVAFISKTKTGEGSSEIFVMPFVGGDPVRVEHNLPASRANGASHPVTRALNSKGETFIGLMEWR